MQPTPPNTIPGLFKNGIHTVIIGDTKTLDGFLEGYCATPEMAEHVRAFIGDQLVDLNPIEVNQVRYLLSKQNGDFDRRYILSAFVDTTLIDLDQSVITRDTTTYKPENTVTYFTVGAILNNEGLIKEWIETLMVH
jgi:hypothetical protein